MHTMSVHNTILWKEGAELPTMLMFHRHSAYRADEVANPDVIDFLIRNPNPVTGLNAFGSPSNQFNSAMRRTFAQFAYGGYNIIHDVSQSVPTRIGVDQTRELTQLWDMNHPDAFAYNVAEPKFSGALLNNSDAELNVDAFRDMGYSRGLYYDMYCPGFATLEDGRAVFMGGHDMNSQNGLYRIQIFDPDTETWAPRPISCMRELFGSDPEDPYFESYYQAEIDRLAAEGLDPGLINDFYLPIGSSLSGDCDPHDIDPFSYSPTYPEIRLAGEGTVTQPGKLSSDMRYARWYPTGVALPGNRIFIFAGWDRDELNRPQWPTSISSTTTAMQPFFDAKAANPELYPDIPPTAHLAGFLRSSGDNDFLSSRVKIPVPEVYDAKRDTTIALENARLFHSAWYPNGTVVQTGPRRNDWKVFVLNGELLEDVEGGVTNGSADRGFRKTWLVDVQGALNDRSNRDVPSEREGKFVQFVDEAPTGLSPFSANANMIELDKRGNVVSHTLTHFGGQEPVQTTNTDKVVQIQFAALSAKGTNVKPAELPKWQLLPATLYQRARQNYATPLPDGTVVILGGNGGTLPGIEAWSLHLQHFDPATGELRRLAKSLIPRDEHGIIQLMPDGTVYLGGQNRNGMVRPGDPAAPLGDSDLGVPAGQLFYPPYLFDPATGELAERPTIVSAPEIIKYGHPFKIKVDTAKGIQSVVLIRTGSMSHSLATDVRYVKIPFQTKMGKPTTGLVDLTAFSPKLPGTAIGGYYYLFVVDEAGVPSVSTTVALGTQVGKRIKALKKAGLLPAA
jgi:hypothetical protein